MLEGEGLLARHHDNSDDHGDNNDLFAWLYRRHFGFMTLFILYHSLCGYHDLPDRCETRTVLLYTHTYTPEHEAACAKLVCRTGANIGNLSLNLSH